MAFKKCVICGYGETYRSIKFADNYTAYFCRTCWNKIVEVITQGGI